MIDIHNHIIFSVDDGSESLEQSIRMIKAAKNAGVTEICFSPHYMEDGYHTERKVLEEKVLEIQRALVSEEIDIPLYLGEEVFIFPSLPESLEKVVCLNDSRYLLMEFPLVEEISFIDDVIYRLFSLGKVPIIAHPERYLATERDFSFIQKIAAKGALLQINANSLINHYGKQAKSIAMRLLKENMVHFVGSDAHSSAGYSKLSESLEVIRKLVGEEKFLEITVENQRKVLNNEEIESNYQLEETRPKKRLFESFWKRMEKE